MNILYIFILIICPLLTSIFLLKKIIVKNSNSMILKTNFLGTKTSAAGGIVLILSFAWYLILKIVLYFIDKPQSLNAVFYYFLFYISFLIAGLGGVIDDIYGQQKPKGLKGHIKYLFYEHKISTGILKIIFTFIAAVIFIFCIRNSFVEELDSGFLELLGNTNPLLIILIIMLFTNFFNLLDLRPGRTVKTFLLLNFFSLLIFPPFLGTYLSWWIFILLGFLLPIIFPLFIYLPYDLAGKIMLGDAGSNFLGFIMGVIVVLLYPLPLQIIWLVFLIVVHIYAEKYSISDLIESNKFLLFFDNVFLPQEIREKKRQIYEEKKRNP